MSIQFSKSRRLCNLVIMKTQLATLDKLLSALRPGFYEKLQPGLTDQEIKALQEQYDVELPEDVIALYKWKNGQQNDCYEAFINNSMFMPLEEVLESSAELSSMIGYDFEIENWWHKDWLPLFHNGGGDHTCYDMAGLFTGNAGQLIEFWHADNDRNVIAPSLVVFFDNIVAYYKNTPADKFDEYFQMDDIPDYPQKFIVE